MIFAQIQTSVDPWFIVSLGLLFALVAMFALLATRERHLSDLSHDQTSSVERLGGAITGYTDSFRTAFSSVTDGLRSLERQVERSDELSEHRRQEIIRLVVDVERRLTDAMRDWASRLRSPGGTNVNINGGANGTQIGDGNSQL